VNLFLAKYDFASKEIAAPIGALLMTESTQRPFCVFCGNWIVGLSELRLTGTSRWLLTDNGRRIVTTLLAAQQADVDQLTKMAA
jgi:hypothetical protein